MDENYLLAAARYVELNPVAVGLVDDPALWPWSSTVAHLAGSDDGVATVPPLLEMAGDWQIFLSGCGEETFINELRKHERTGRPLGSESFVDRLEMTLARPLKLGRPGRKRM